MWRHELSENQWNKIKDLFPQRGSLRADGMQRATAGCWTRFCIGWTRGSPGALCHNAMAPGRPCTAVSTHGRRQMYGNRSSMHWLHRIWWMGLHWCRIVRPKSTPAWQWGWKGGCDEEAGRSRGGLATKIHMVTDRPGNPLHFLLSSSNRNDSCMAHTLPEPFDLTGKASLSNIPVRSCLDSFLSLLFY